MGYPQPRDRMTIGGGGAEPEATTEDVGTKGTPDALGSTHTGAVDPGQSPTPGSLAHETSATGVGDPTLVPKDDAAPTHRPVPSIPGYLIEGELGRGAMGVVYLGRQVRLNRPCALKVILAGAHADPVAAGRFIAEAEAVAKLQHPHIVQIHNIGESDGLPFLELEYLAGGSLDRRLDGTPWPARRATALVETLARGVAEAHRLGVIHRDLKPSNILLAADGTPKVSDFGLAKVLDVESGLTATESILGTPSYMAPEQAEGKAKQVGPLADVYALGAVLYELLVGRPPFRGGTVLETLEQVKGAEPVPPTRLVPGLPRDVETIALKCLQKEPGKRYDSAAALADDLRRFVEGEPIRARPVSGWEWVLKWARRRPAVAGLLAVCFVAALAVVGAIVGAVFNARLRVALHETQLARDAEKEQRQKAEQFQYFHHIARASAGWREGNVGEQVDQLLEYLPPEQRRWEWYYLKRLCHADILTLTGHTAAVYDVAFSPKGRWLASASYDGTVKVWDMTTGKLLRDLSDHTGAVYGVAFSPDGTRIASAGQDQTVKIWDSTRDRKPLTLTGHAAAVYDVAFSPKGRWLASASYDGTVKVWDMISGQEAGILKGHAAWVYSLAFSPDGTRIATASMDQTVKVWDTATCHDLLTLRGHNNLVWDVAFSPDGTRIASAGRDGTVKLWDARPWTPEAALEREALGLLDFLFAKPLSKADVLEYLRASPTIRPGAQKLAQSLVNLYHEEAEPGRYHRASWAIVRQPYLSALQYRFALHQAETANRLASDQGEYVTTLGTAQYRAGQYRDALATLTKAEQLPQASPANLAFLAMAWHRLGHEDRAHAVLVQLREAARGPMWAQHVEAQGFLKEAEALIIDAGFPNDPFAR
jgi:hypothetical protein